MSTFNDLKSILLIDDDESSNFLHSIFINKLGLDINIHSALNGQEGLDFILNKGVESLQLPCMVMLDIRMPVMDGWQFIKNYEEQVPKELKEQIVVVLVTISNSGEDKKRAMENRYIMDFAQKPLSDTAFRKLTNKHFSLTRAKAT